MDRKGIIGVALCTALLMLWYWHMASNAARRPPRPLPPTPVEGTVGGEPVGPADGGGAVVTPETGGGDEPGVGAGTQETPEVSPDPGEVAVAAPPQVGARPDGLPGFGVPSEDSDPVRLASADVAEFAVDAVRGGCEGATLLTYLVSGGDSSIVLGDPTFPFLASTWAPSSVGASTSRVVEQEPGRLVIERTFVDPGLVLTESWETVPEKEYHLRYRVSCRNTSGTPIDLSNLAVSCGQMALESGPSMPKVGRAGMTDLAVDILQTGNEKPSTFAPKKIAKQSAAGRTELNRTSTRWVAVHNKYFVFYVALADGDFSGVDVGLDEPEEGGAVPVCGVAFLPSVPLAPDAEESFTIDAYAGPKELRRLKEIGGGVERIMRLDVFFWMRPKWMGALTSFILKSLISLNRTFDHKWGYGFAIVVITFVIKMLFWPLTHRSTVSMRKMQKLQPLIQEIRDKYKDQPQKLQQKTMELYREHKVNPLGGCLPILFQIPVFFALFNTFRSAIELRQAAFLWVVDLSQPDTLSFITAFPVRPLAILMGATMILQQVTTPTSGDPQQKRMMTFMTVFFMFIFYGMPAGLTLYWTVNQVLTLIQNVVSRRLDKDGHGATA